VEARRVETTSGGSTISQLAFVTAGKGLSFAVALATNVMLVRWLGPEQYGVFAACNAAILLVSGIAGEALDFATVKFVSSTARTAQSGAARSFSTVLVLKAGVGLLSSLIAVGAFSFWGPALLGDEASPILAWYFSLAVLGLLAHKTISTLFTAQESFRKHVTLELTHTTLKFFLVASLAAAGLLSGSLAVLVIAVAPVLGLLLNARGLERGYFRPDTVGFDSIVEVFNFSRWVMLSFGISAIHSRLDVLMLGHFRENAEVGIYSASLTLGLGIELVATFASTVFYPKILPLQASGELGRFFYRVLFLSLPIVAFGIVAAYVVSGPLISALYGPEYSASIPILRLHAAGYLIWWIVFPLSCPILFMMRPQWMVAVDLFTLVLIGIGNLYFIPAIGALGAAVVFAGAKLLVACVILALATMVVRTPGEQFGAGNE
jgi:O-antigen/teichoic acid export membrane protein